MADGILATLAVPIFGDDSRLVATLASVERRLVAFGAKLGRTLGGSLVTGPLNDLANVLSRGIGGAFLAAGASMAYATKKAIDLESKFARISRVTGLAGDDLAGLRKELSRLATTMPGVGLGDILDVAEIGGRLGVARDQLVGFTKAVSQLRIVFDDIPADELANSVSRILTVFGRGIDEATSLASALTYLDNSSTATAAEILDLTRRMGGAASTIGATPEQVMALAAAMRDAGINVEVGGTAISQIFTKMATDSEKFAAIAGVSVKRFEKALTTDPIAALRLLLGGLEQLDEVSQFRALDSLGLEGQRVAGSLLQLGRVIDRIPGMVATANREWETHASIERQVEVSSRTTAAQLSLLWNNLQLLADGIGQAVLPIIRALAAAFGQVATDLQASVAQQQGSMSGWQQAIVGAIEAAMVAWRNFGDVIELSQIMIEEKLTNAVEIVEWFVKTSLDLAEWLGDNWWDVMHDAAAAIGTIFYKLTENLVNMIKAAWGFISSGGTQGFEFEWQPLLDGFESTVSQLPAIAAPHLTSLEDRWNATVDRIANREQKLIEQMDQAKKAAAAPPTAAVGVGAGVVGAFAAGMQKSMTQKPYEAQRRAFGGDEGKSQFIPLEQMSRGIAAGAASQMKPMERAATAAELTARQVQLAEVHLRELVRLARTGGSFRLG